MLHEAPLEITASTRLYGRIDQPFPRNADFRVSTEFAGYCRQVSQALERASAMGQPQEIKA